MQKLILPINKTRVTSGYKNVNYKNQFGYTHFGMDMTSNNDGDVVWASGVGEVVEAGWSPICGNVMVIKYKDCQMSDGSSRDLIFRYYHLLTMIRKKGDKVTKDSRIGRYGNTGTSSAGAHLHLEIDTDCDYPCHTPQLSKNSGVLKKGIDSTVNPVDVLHIKKTNPDNQSAIKSHYNTLTDHDIKFKTY